MTEMRFTVNNPQTDDRGVTALSGVDHPGRGDFFFVSLWCRWMTITL